MAALRDHVYGATKLHADDTPVPMLMPGTGKMRQARLWTHIRDDRPHGGTAAPAVWFRYSPDRKGVHPQTHLKDFTGTLQADAFAGYNAVYEMGRVLQARLFGRTRVAGSATPMSMGRRQSRRCVLDRIGELYRIEPALSVAARRAKGALSARSVPHLSSLRCMRG